MTQASQSISSDQILWSSDVQSHQNRTLRALTSICGALLVLTIFGSTALAQEETSVPESEATVAEEEAPIAPPDAPAPPMPENLQPPGEMPPGLDEAEDVETENLQQVSAADWNRNDWMLLRPDLSLLELDGYFRFRVDLFRRLGFGNQSTRYAAQSGTTEEPGEADFTGANIRLRLEPIINVARSIQIVTTIDVLDNLTLGSTPESLATLGAGTPLHLINRGQNVPVKDLNALTDSIVIKRAYGKARILNDQIELRFGRMPDHFGLGILANNGDCLDCDSGDVADRIQLSFKAVEHVFSLMWDWGSNGPQVDTLAGYRQPLDAVDWDDVSQYSVRITHVDHPDDIQNALSRGEFVANYGTWVSWKVQDYDLGSSYYTPAGETEASTDPTRSVDLASHQEERSANVVTTDIFGHLYWKKLTLSMEGVFRWGKFTDRGIQSNAEKLAGTQAAPESTEMLQWGGALEATYSLEDELEGLNLKLMAGAASGDSAPGFGALDQAGSQRGYFRSDAEVDRKLDNFQFSPNYHIDLLMFRRIIGTVTDSWYVSPGVHYAFNDQINLRSNMTYSQAIMKRSTPSCASVDDTRCRTGDSDSGSRLMGLEIDAEATYSFVESNHGNQFMASLAAGFLFPLGAFNNPLLADENAQSPEFAWTVQTRLYMTF